MINSITSDESDDVDYNGLTYISMVKILESYNKGDLIDMSIYIYWEKI